MNLNEYFDNIDINEFIIAIAVCDEGSKKLDYISAPPLTLYLKGTKLGFRDAAVVLIDSGKFTIHIDREHVELIDILKNIDDSKTSHIRIVSDGFGSPYARWGSASFEIEGVNHELMGNRGLNFCIISKMTLEVVDMFSVDTFDDSSLQLHRFVTWNSLVESAERGEDLNLFYHYYSKLKKSVPAYRLTELLKKLSSSDEKFKMLLIKETIDWIKSEQKLVKEMLSELQRSKTTSIAADAYASMAELYWAGEFVSRNQDYATHLMEQASSRNKRYNTRLANMLSRSTLLSERKRADVLVNGDELPGLKARIRQTMPKANVSEICRLHLKQLEKSTDSIDDALAYILENSTDINLDWIINRIIDSELSRTKNCNANLSDLSNAIEKKISHLLTQFESFIEMLGHRFKTVQILCSKEFFNLLSPNCCSLYSDHSINEESVIVALLGDNIFPNCLQGKRFIGPTFVYDYCLAIATGEFCRHYNISLDLEELPRKNRILLSPEDVILMDSLSFPGFNMHTQKQYISDAYVDEPDCKEFVLSGEWVKIHNNGVHNELMDLRSKHMNIVNGKRVTVGNPSRWKSSVFFYGPCVVRGLYVDDNNTIPSLFQKGLPKSKGDVRTVNCGVDGTGVFRDLEYLLSTHFHQGDHIFIINWFSPLVKTLLVLYGARYEDLSVFFSRDNCSKRYFLKDETHFSVEGNRVLARHLNERFLEIEPRLKSEGNCSFGLDRYMTNAVPGLMEYIDSIRPYRINSGRNGAIVMNCNPFTLGHQHLVEYAASKVDHLYIFVVEEDRSMFKFEDRFRLVKEGTAHLKNVIVLKSGNFIISQVTFPQYFGKDKDKRATVDASSDLRIFGRFICPALGITVRFVGMEPFDNVTNQYNTQMKEILPTFGVELIEIPRMEINGVSVSASLVRRLMSEGDWVGLKQIVPRSTFKFLSSEYQKY